MELNWISSTTVSPLPPMAVIGGHDIDQSPIYVGRTFFEGDLLPAKIIPSKRSAYVCWGGREIPKMDYEILTGSGYVWIPCEGGNIPQNATKGGYTITTEPLFIGRSHHHGSLCVGKIQPSHNCLYIPFDGEEVKIKHHYEVLVSTSAQNMWVPSSGGNTPPNAVVGGHDFDRTVLYVGRAQHEGEMLPAKIVPSKGCAFISFQGYEIPKINFEVLTGQQYYWEKEHHHVAPPNAVSTGFSRSGEPLFVGRGHHMLSLLPGVISVSQRALYVPYDKREVRIDSYEFLCRE